MKAVETKKRVFVVQRHLSSVLHYDLRIEVNGVLKSWAIPTGPSMNVRDRRLAVSVPDQPLRFATVKGIIPEGREGAGIIEMWDKGEFIPHFIRSCGDTDENIRCDLRDGRLKFTLKGKKLRGVFTLVRLGNGRNDHWLLIKGNDKFSVDHPYSSEAYTGLNSPINKILKSRDHRRSVFLPPATAFAIE